jgi:hypothetical protein
MTKVYGTLTSHVPPVCYLALYSYQRHVGGSSGAQHQRRAGTTYDLMRPLQTQVETNLHCGGIKKWDLLETMR